MGQASIRRTRTFSSARTFGWRDGEKGVLVAADGTLELRSSLRADASVDRPASITNKGRLGAPFQSIEKGQRGRRELRRAHWTVPVAASNRPSPALCRCLFGGARRHLRSRRFAHPDADRPRGRADLGGLPVRQPLFDDPGAGTVLPRDQINRDASRTAYVFSARRSMLHQSTATIRSPGRGSGRPRYYDPNHLKSES